MTPFNLGELKIRGFEGEGGVSYSPNPLKSFSLTLKKTKKQGLLNLPHPKSHSLLPPPPPSHSPPSRHRVFYYKFIIDQIWMGKTTNFSPHPNQYSVETGV